ncbi:hypothetical protein [Bradyrhizobium sp. JR3.5]
MSLNPVLPVVVGLGGIEHRRHRADVDIDRDDIGEVAGHLYRCAGRLLVDRERNLVGFAGRDFSVLHVFDGKARISELAAGALAGMCDSAEGHRSRQGRRAHR